MRLSEASNRSVVESLFVSPLPISEAGEAPRWRFRYDNWQQDPHPNILLLGDYVHPSTQNNLVGGINLNYLSKSQRDTLARALPKIMSGRNLYYRYHLGKSLVPDVFDNFYRTYNSNYIRGVEQGVMFPKYGFMKTAKDYLKKTVGSIFKSKAQREKEAQPQFPKDLSNMKDQLDMAVNTLNTQAAQGQRYGVPAPETPEMQAARENFRNYQIDRARRLANKPEQVQLQQAQQDLEAQQLRRGAVPPQATSPQAQQQAQQEPGISPQKMGELVERERQKNQEELRDPKNNLNDDFVEESISYYSPVQGRYIVEILERKLALRHRLHALRSQIAAAAQIVYDAWDDLDEFNDYGSGGICDHIMDAIGNILSDNGIDYVDGGHEGDDHAYAIAHEGDIAYVVDIPYSVYEIGGGYNWQKIPDIQITPDDIEIYQTHKPDWAE